MQSVILRVASEALASRICDCLLDLGALSASLTLNHTDSKEHQTPNADVNLQVRLPHKVEAFFPTERNLESIVMSLYLDFDLTCETEPFRFVSGSAVPDAVLNRDWVSYVQQSFDCTVVGRIIVRSHQSPPSVADAKGQTQQQSGNYSLEIVIDPGASFGTGQHATTSLALSWLQDYADGLRCRATGPVLEKWRCLDYGCGTGLLAIAAVLLGADSAYGCDIENAAIETARENALLNSCAHSVIFGSVSEEAHLWSMDSRTNADREYNVVIANILAVTLKTLAHVLVTRVAPGGFLVLSGILLEQAVDVSEVFSNEGLSLKSSSTKDGWALLVGRKLPSGATVA